MFVTFYFMVLTGYRAIHKNEAQTNASSDIRLYIKSGTFDWKVTAIAANWLIMGFCSGQTAFFLSRVFPETTETFLFAIFLIFGEFSLNSRTFKEIKYFFNSFKSCKIFKTSKIQICCEISQFLLLLKFRAIFFSFTSTALNVAATISFGIGIFKVSKI